MKLMMVMTAVLVCAACANDAAPETTAENEGKKPPRVAETPGPLVEGDMAEKCPVIDSRNWTAWIDAEPPGPARLHIRGEVDLPTPGYEASWRVGIADRAMPPGVHFHLDFSAPEGMVTQVVTTESVAYEDEAAYPAYRVIYVHCGEETLAEITDIPTAN